MHIQQAIQERRNTSLTEIFQRHSSQDVLSIETLHHDLSFMAGQLSVLLRVIGETADSDIHALLTLLQDISQFCQSVDQQLFLHLAERQSGKAGQEKTPGELLYESAQITLTAIKEKLLDYNVGLCDIDLKDLLAISEQLTSLLQEQRTNGKQ